LKIHGKLSHYAGSLLPKPGDAPVYGQLYIHDPQEALDFRMNHRANAGLDRATMQQLQDMLFNHHPGVHLYKQANELTKDMPPEHQCIISLRYDRELDRRRYNLPTAAANEVAAILPGDGDQPVHSREIILHRRHGATFQRIHEWHPFYLPLHYVLLFPTGQEGWHPRIPFYGHNQLQGRDHENELALAEHEDNPEEGAPNRKRKYISQTEYFRYRLHPRFEESDHFFHSKRLFQEFAVDCWAASEQCRLNYIQFNQNTLRMDSRQALMDALAVDVNAPSDQSGQ
jgi:hypothetical protein